MSNPEPSFKESFPVLGPQPTREEIEEFQRFVLDWGSVLYRDLPWRNTKDPYEIWISEAMLQQTQVTRVLQRWPRFLKLFPSIDSVASASVGDVLEEWQGLGYNRRALALKQVADICSKEFAGRLPVEFDELLALPGIGPATAAGIRAFAYGLPGVYMETNVKAVHIAAFFPGEEKITDKRLAQMIEATCYTEDPRRWYYALLDVGVKVKQEFGNPTRKSASYTVQSTFEGSWRQKRAEVLRTVIAKPGISEQEVCRMLSAFEQKAGREAVDAAVVEALLSELQKEGFIHQVDGRWKA